MDFSRLDQLWRWYTQDDAFVVDPRDPSSGAWDSMERGTVVVIAVAFLVIVFATAAFVLSSEFLALSAAFLGGCVLAPLSFDQSRRKSRAVQRLRSAILGREAERASLEHDRKQLASLTEDVQAKAAKVEKQYQTLSSLAGDRSPAGRRPEDADRKERDGIERELQEAIKRLRSSEHAESVLANRVREVETARKRAEAELSRLMSESHAQLMTERDVAAAERRIEEARKEAREILEQAEEDARIRSLVLLEQAQQEALSKARERARQAEDEALAQARDFVEQMKQEARDQALEIVEQAEEEARTEARDILEKAEEEARTRVRKLLELAEEEAARIAARGRSQLDTQRSEAERQELPEEGFAEELIRNARIRARELVERAEEEADRLAAQGKAEFESILREIQQKEQVEKDLYERILALEAQHSEAELAPQQADPMPVEPASPERVPWEDSSAGSSGAIRKTLGSLLRRRTGAD